MIFLRSIRLADPARIAGNPAQLKFPYNVPAVRHIGSFEFRHPVTFLAGENGTGKSTLLEALMNKYEQPDPYAHGMLYDYAEAKTYVNDLPENLVLDEQAHPLRRFFFRAETFFEHAEKTDAKADREEFLYGKSYTLEAFGGRRLLEQSHGESFLNTFLNCRGRNTLFLLDEPEAALSPQRQLSLLVRIRELVAQDAQLIISTHSPLLLGYPGADIYQIDDTGARLVAYEDTEHYRLTHYFLNHRERMLAELFRESV